MNVVEHSAPHDASIDGSGLLLESFFKRVEVIIVGLVVIVTGMVVPFVISVVGLGMIVAGVVIMIVARGLTSGDSEGGQSRDKNRGDLHYVID